MNLPVSKREVYASDPAACRGRCIGVTHSAKKPCYLARSSDDDDVFVKEIAGYVQQHDAKFPFAAIAINRGGRSKIHTDRNNIGMSMSIAIGPQLKH